MSLRLGMPVVVIAALSIPLVAQTRPNLAGKWEQVYEKSTPVRPAPTPPFPPTTISQDANTIAISFVSSTPMLTGSTANSASGQMTSVPREGKREDFPYTLTYVCDSAEHPEPDKVPPVAPTQAPPSGARVTTMTFANPTYVATWTDGQLVITTRATTRMDPPSPTFKPQQRSVRKTYSIDKDGFLIIESLTTYEPPSSGAAPTPTRAVYRKIS
jgi:hypothetical protein